MLIGSVYETGLMPPTVAGPMIPTPFSSANLFSFRVCDSGTPVAMMVEIRR